MAAPIEEEWDRFALVPHGRGRHRMLGRLALGRGERRQPRKDACLASDLLSGHRRPAGPREAWGEVRTSPKWRRRAGDRAGRMACSISHSYHRLIARVSEPLYSSLLWYGRVVPSAQRSLRRSASCWRRAPRPRRCDEAKPGAKPASITPSTRSLGSSGHSCTTVRSPGATNSG
jgi:hypothetical protein